MLGICEQLKATLIDIQDTDRDESSLGKVGFEMLNGGNIEVLRGVCLEFRTVILTKEARLVLEWII